MRQGVQVWFPGAGRFVLQMFYIKLRKKGLLELWYIVLFNYTSTAQRLPYYNLPACYLAYCKCIRCQAVGGEVRLQLAKFHCTILVLLFLCKFGLAVVLCWLYLSHWFVVQNKYMKLAYWWMPLLICQIFHSLAVCYVLVSIGIEFSYLCITLVGT